MPGASLGRTKDFSKQWKEYSFDFKLMFGYHGCMMALFMLGGFLSVRQELLITAVAAGTVVSLSIRNRREKNWRWGGAGTKRVLAAIGIAVASAIFDFAAVPSAPPSDSRFLPWHLAGLGIAVFGILNALNVVQMSQAEFEKECEGGGGAKAQSDAVAPVAAVAAEPIDPLWKRAVRGVIYVAFLSAWLGGVSYFYFSGKGMRDGSRTPTAAKTEPLRDHGRVVYVGKSEKELIDFLGSVLTAGIPTVILCGLFLNFIVGVKIFENVPTMAEWRRDRAKRMAE